MKNSHGVSLGYWVGGLMYFTVQTRYNIQYLTMSLSGYINSPKEPAFLDLRNGMEYIMHHPHESILYPINKLFKVSEIPHQFFFKTGISDINKNQ